MTRIKSNNVQFGGAFVVPLEEKSKNISISHADSRESEMILNAKAEAQQIVETAQNQANQMIEGAKAQAQEEIAQMAEQARKDGFAVGKKQGNDAIIKELSDKIIAVNDFAKGCFEVKNAIVKSAHLDIVELITQIAHKICSKSLELDNKVLEDITINAIRALKDKESINIIVNPEMAERIYAISEDLKEQIPQLESIKIIEDGNVSPDGTIIESPLSRVDSRVSSQINAIVEKLMSELNSTDANDLLPQECEPAEAENSIEEIENSIEETEEISDLGQDMAEESEEVQAEIINPETAEAFENAEEIPTFDINLEESLEDDGFKELEIPFFEEKPNPDESN